MNATTPRLSDAAIAFYECRFRTLTDEEKRFLRAVLVLPPVEQEGIQKALELCAIEKYQNKTNNILERMNAGVLGREEGFKQIDRLWRRKDLGITSVKTMDH